MFCANIRPKTSNRKENAFNLTERHFHLPLSIVIFHFLNLILAAISNARLTLLSTDFA